MNVFPQTPELIRVAERVVWFKDAAETLSDPVHFLAHVMTFGSVADIEAVQRVVDLTEFRETLEHAPPGIFDPRSWAYWNLKCGIKPALPLPVRRGLFPVRAKGQSVSQSDTPDE